MQSGSKQLTISMYTVCYLHLQTKETLRITRVQPIALQSLQRDCMFCLRNHNKSPLMKKDLERKVAHLPDKTLVHHTQVKVEMKMHKKEFVSKQWNLFERIGYVRFQRLHLRRAIS